MGNACLIEDSILVISNNATSEHNGLTNYMEPSAIHHLLFSPSSDFGVLSELALWAGLFGFIFVAILLFPLCFGDIKEISKRLTDIRLKVFFFVVWIFGFLVYDIGMCTGHYISLLTNAPMAILYAFKIFLFDSDVSEIHEPFHSSWVYSLFFALAHFFAAVFSTLFLIKYFGYTLRSNLRMWSASGWRGRNVSKTYVFWGINEQTNYLIESIQNKDKNQNKDKKSEDTDYRIIIVRTSKSDDDRPEDRSALARIFEFIAMPSSERENLQKSGCLVTSSTASLLDIDTVNGQEDIIGKKLRLKSLKKILQHHTADEIHLFFLNDDEKTNLHNVALLLNDSTITDFVKSPDAPMRKVKFYCLARYNSVHRVIEDQNSSDKIKVNVVDSSHINVEMLKEKPDLLPVNYVNVEKDATVSTPFNALVVGFSEVGQDSVRFLYEFGAFVKSGSTDEVAIRSDFHLDVVDKNMADLAGVFVTNAPSIKPSMPFIKDGENPDALIALHQMDCRSVQFYQKLTDEWIHKLNYVVIATDNDELNLSLGIRIFKTAIRYRNDMKNFCILVRAHRDDDGHIARIAKYYNRLWAAYEIAPEVNKKRNHQNKIKNDAEVEAPIHIFGLDKTTFTYDNIIDDQIVDKARGYADRYETTTAPNTKTKETAWDKRVKKIMHLDGNYIGYSPTYFGMMFLRRTQSQDLANSQHEQTKRILIDRALERSGLKNFEFSKLTRMPKTTKHIWPRNEKVLEEINRIAIVIAQTEHLRWNASHEILGYVYSDEKDEIRCQHNCLKDWEKLDEETQSYDCDVSDFILGIKFKV